MSDDDRQEWLKNAGVLQVQLHGVATPMYMTTKVFKSGSVGWFLSQKAVVGETPCQVNLCITAIGTKRPTQQTVSPSTAINVQEEPETPQELFPNGQVTDKAVKVTRKRPRAS